MERSVGGHQSVAAQPGAVTLVPAMPAAALIAIAVGGLWLCLWRSRWRFLGVAVIAGGLLLGWRRSFSPAKAAGER